MSKRSITIEIITEIEKALQQECESFCMDDEKDRARLAWWIFEKFVDGDFAERAARQDIPSKPIATVDD